MVIFIDIVFFTFCTTFFIPWIFAKIYQKTKPNIEKWNKCTEICANIMAWSFRIFMIIMGIVALYIFIKGWIVIFV